MHRIVICIQLSKIKDEIERVLANFEVVGILHIHHASSSFYWFCAIERTGPCFMTSGWLTLKRKYAKRLLLPSTQAQCQSRRGAGDPTDVARCRAMRLPTQPGKAP